MSGFPRSFVDEVRRSADPVRVIGEVVPLKRRGARFVGLCPFHQEKTPSFTVNDEGLWYCFGCGAGGDLFGFVMEYEGMDFPEAVRAVAERSGIPVPDDADTRRSGGRSEAEVDRRRLVAALEEAAGFYEERLRAAAGKPGRQFLEERGIGQEVAERFALGFAPDSWQALRSHLHERGFDDRELEAAGLVKPRGDSSGAYDRLRSRLVFPIRDLRGRTIAFGGRIVGEGEPKYLNSPETAVFSKSRTLYGLREGRDAVRDRGWALLVEGYVDLLACVEAGFRNVVAPLGTSFTEGHAELLRRFATKSVIAFDGDDAGLAAAERTAEVFLSRGFRVTVLSLPPGHDPDSFLRSEGSEAFADALRGCQPAFRFLVERAGERFDLTSPQGKAEALSFLLEFVAAVENRVERAEWIGRVAEALDVDRQLAREAAEEVIDEAGRARGREGPTAGRPAEERSGAWRTRLAEVSQAERRLLAAVLERPEWAEPLLNTCGREAIRDSRVRGLLEAVEECRREEDGVVPPAVLSRCDVEGAEGLLAAVRLEEDVPGTWDEAQNCALGVRRDALKRKRRGMEGEIQEAERRGDTERIDKLNRRYHELTQEIQEIDRR